MGTEVKPEDNTVEKALKLFPYFDTWNTKTITDCCRLSRIKVIPPDGIVLDSEQSAGVHFIIEGTCKLIEHLSLVVKKGPSGRMKYTIFNDQNPGRQINADNEPKYSSLLFNMERAIGLENEEEHTLCEKVITLSKVPKEMDCGTETTESKENSPEEVSVEKVKKIEPPMKKPTKFSQFYKRMLPYITAKRRTLPETSSKVESHFLQIALVHKGCCLGLGENLRNRYLVSVTTVTCLVIPLRFLLQHNPNNIWNRIKQFLNDYLPSEERILSEFIINKKWNECKRKWTSPKNVRSWTKMSDVPKSIRLSEINMRLDMFQRIFLQPP